MSDKKRGKYRRYSLEFKDEAVNLVTGQARGDSINQNRQAVSSLRSE
jgi:hypothetical protein